MTPAVEQIVEEDARARVLRVKTPAWLMSIGLHLIVLLIGLLLFMQCNAAPPRAAANSGPRQSGIALADAKSRITYFADDRGVQVDGGETSLENAAGDPNATLHANDLNAPSNTVAGSLDFSSGPPLPEPSIEPSPLLLGDAPLVVQGDAPGLPQLRVANRPMILPGLGDAEILAEEEARRVPVVPRGPQTKMSLFGGAPATGNSFCFLIDRSQSMGGEGLNALVAAEKELNRELGKLEPAHKFQIIAYNQQTLYLSDRGLLTADAENRTKAAKFLGGLVAFAGTQHEMALMAGLRLQPDVIFLLTDGGDPYITSAEVGRITERNAGRTAIHCIHFGDGPEPAEISRGLRELVRKNGGSYGYVDMHAGK